MNSCLTFVGEMTNLLSALISLNTADQSDAKSALAKLRVDYQILLQE